MFDLPPNVKDLLTNLSNHWGTITFSRSRLPPGSTLDHYDGKMRLPDFRRTAHPQIRIKVPRVFTGKDW